MAPRQLRAKRFSHCPGWLWESPPSRARCSSTTAQARRIWACCQPSSKAAHAMLWRRSLALRTPCREPTNVIDLWIGHRACRTFKWTKITRIMILTKIQVHLSTLELAHSLLMTATWKTTWQTTTSPTSASRTTTRLWHLPTWRKKS